MEEQKKSRKPLLIGIIAAVVVLAVVLALLLSQCVGGQGPSASTDPSGDTTAPGVAQAYNLYWNVDRANAQVGETDNDLAGTTNREPNADGYYPVVFAHEGKQVELLVENRRLVNTIDAYDLMDLVFNDEGIVIDIIRLDDLPLEKVTWQFYIQSIGGNKVKMNSSKDFNGMEEILELPDNVGIYDVSGCSEYIGAPASLQRTDRAYVIANEEGVITHIFLYERQGIMTTMDAYCQHCGEEVTWSNWLKTDALPIDTGHYYLEKDVVVKTQQMLAEDAKVCLDLNGMTVSNNYNGRIYATFNPGTALAIMDNTEEQLGKIVATGTGLDQGNCLWARYGTIDFYSGTLDASGATSDLYGTAVGCEAKTVFNMHGGTIIGGKAVHNEKGQNGQGGAVVVRGIFNMNGGEIYGGQSEALGGNVYVLGGGVFNMNDGVIRDGICYGNNGGNVAVMTGCTFNMNGGMIQGGTATRNAKNSNGAGGNVYLNGLWVMNGGVITGGRCIGTDNKQIPAASNRNFFNVNGQMELYGGTIFGYVSTIDTSATDKKTTSVYLSGLASIYGAAEGHANLTTCARTVINVGMMVDGAKVGVKPSNMIFSTKTSEKNVDNFFSDIKGAGIVHYEGCLAVGKMGCMCGAAEGEDHALGCTQENLYWQPLTTTSITKSGNYYLTSDLTRTSQTVFGQNTRKDTNDEDGDGDVNEIIFTPEDIVCALDMNGYDLTGKNTRGLQVWQNATLYLCNTVPEEGGHVYASGFKPSVKTNAETGKTTTSYENFGVMQTLGTTSSVKMLQGVHLVHTSDAETPADAWIGQGGVAIVSGTFDMYGGTMTGSMARGNGGTVTVSSSGKFTMYGDAAIYGGTTSGISAVYLDGKNAVFTMNGNAKLIGGVNTGTGYNGGNLHVTNGATAIMNDNAYIADGRVYNEGGNVYVGANANLIMNDNAHITGGMRLRNGDEFIFNSGNIFVVNGNVTMNDNAAVDGYFRLYAYTADANVYLSGNPRITGQAAGYEGICLAHRAENITDKETNKVIETVFHTAMIHVDGKLGDKARIDVTVSGPSGYDIGEVTTVTDAANADNFVSTKAYADVVYVADKDHSAYQRLMLGKVGCSCGAANGVHSEGCDQVTEYWRYYNNHGQFEHANENYYLTGDIKRGAIGSRAPGVKLDLNGFNFTSTGRALQIWDEWSGVDYNGELTVSNSRKVENGGIITGQGNSSPVWKDENDDGKNDYIEKINVDHSGVVQMIGKGLLNLIDVTLELDDTTRVYTDVKGNTNKAVSESGVIGGGSGTINAYGTTLIGGDISGNGSVMTSSGKVLLKNCTVVGGSAKSGGALYVSGGNLTLDNTVIYGGTTTGGGGNLYVKGGTVTMNGGKIYGGVTGVENSTTGSNGGNVAIDKGATFVMNSGEIFDGKAYRIVNPGKENNGWEGNGGNVCLFSGATFEMNGGKVYFTTEEIAQVSNGGKNLYSGWANATVKLLGGEIDGYVELRNTSALSLGGDITIDSDTASYNLFLNTNTTKFSVVSEMTGKVGVTYNATGVLTVDAKAEYADYEDNFYSDNPDFSVFFVDNALQADAHQTLFLGREKCLCGANEGEAHIGECLENGAALFAWKKLSENRAPKTSGYYFLYYTGSETFVVKDDQDNIQYVEFENQTYNTATSAELNVVIDLEGYKLDGPDNRLISFLNNSTTAPREYPVHVTFTDSSEGHTGVIGTNGVFNGKTFAGTGTPQGILFWFWSAGDSVNVYRATMDTTSVKVSAFDNSSSKNNVRGVVVDAGTGETNFYNVTINAGEASYGNVVRMSGNAKVNIVDSTINCGRLVRVVATKETKGSQGLGGFYVDGGELTITNSTINSASVNYDSDWITDANNDSVVDGESNYGGLALWINNGVVNLNDTTVNKGSDLNTTDANGVKLGSKRGGTIRTNGGTLNLNGATTVYGTKTQVEASALYMGNGTVNMNAGENGAPVIDGSGISTVNRGATISQSQGTLNLNAGKIIGGETGQGGAIYANGVVNINGGEIYGGHATSGGGNIYITSSATVTMNGGKIYNGVAGTENSTNGSNGGNVHLQGSAKFTMNGGEIFDGKAYRIVNPGQENNGWEGNGGNILLNASAKFTMNNGKVYFTSEDVAQISNGGKNIYAGWADAVITLRGGEVDGYVETRSTSSVVLGGNIKVCSTTAGKNIHLNSSTSKITIEAGLTGDKTIGITYNTPNVGFTVADASYGQYTGVFYPDNGEGECVHVTDPDHADYNRLAFGVVHCQCSADPTVTTHAEGCSQKQLFWQPWIYSAAGQTLAAGQNRNFYLVEDLVKVSNEVNNQRTAQFSVNAVMNLDMNGYNLYSTARAFQIWGDNGGKLTISNTQPTKGGKVSAEGYNGDNYGVVQMLGAAEITLLKGVTLEQAVVSGKLVKTCGVTEVGSKAKFISYGATINGGTVSDNYPTISTGGTVKLLAGTTVNGGTTPKEKSGAAIRMSGGTLEITDSTVNGGKIGGWADSNGGGIYATAGTIDLNNATINGATGSKRGGGLYLYGSVDVTMDGGSIMASEGEIAGAALYVDRGAHFTLNSGLISGNGKASTFAGAVLVEGRSGNGIRQSVFTMNGGEISGGTANGSAADNGGGNVRLANSGSRAQFIMNGGTIKGGISKQAGGNVDISNSDFIMNGGTIENGSAVRGGNIYLNAGATFTLNNGTIQNGVSSNQGGNIFVNNGEFKLIKGEVKDGTATVNAGNVYVNNGGTLTMGSEGETDNTKAQILNGTNLAKVSGGADPNGGSIYINGGGTFNLKSGTVSGGNSENVAGNIRMDGIMNMSGGIVKEGKLKGKVNNGDSSNMQIVGANAHLNMTGGTIEGHVATYSTPKIDLANNATIIRTNPDGTLAENGKLNLHTNAKINSFTNWTGTLGLSMSTVDGVISNQTFDAATAAQYISQIITVNPEGLHYIDNADLPEYQKLYIGHYACLCGANPEIPATSNTEAVPAEAHLGDCLAGGGKKIIWTRWTTTNAMPITSGNWYLAQDITYTGVKNSLIVEENANIVLDLNGQTMDGSNNYRLWRIEKTGDGANVTVTDSGIGHKGTLKPNGQTNQGTIIWQYQGGGNFTLYRGHLDGTNATSTVSGGMICLGSGSSFTMYGGQITGLAMNSTDKGNAHYGGTIALTGGAQGNIYGGTITGGKAVKGGNVYLNGANTKLTLHGGTIENGVAYHVGGNIFVSGAATFVLNGTEAVDGEATVTYTGEVLNGQTTGKLYDGVTAANDAPHGGNIYAEGGTFVEVHGGRIFGGKTAGVAGNMRVDGTLTMDGGIITGQQNSSNIQSLGTIKLSGGTVTGEVDGYKVVLEVSGSAKLVTLDDSLNAVSGIGLGYQAGARDAMVSIGAAGLAEDAKIAVKKTVDTKVIDRGTLTDEQWAAYKEYLDNGQIVTYAADSVLSFEADGIYIRSTANGVRYSCECGATGEEEHKGGCQGYQIAWKPYEMKGNNGLPKTEGNWYLVDADGTDDGKIVATGNTINGDAAKNTPDNAFNVRVDLNGLEVSGPTGTGRFYVIFGDSNWQEPTVRYINLVVTDTVGNGKLIGRTVNTGDHSPNIWMREDTQTLTMYNVTVDASAVQTRSSACVSLTSGKAWFYDCTFIGSTNVTSNAANVDTGSSETYMEGCTLMNGSAGTHGGNLYTGNGKVTLKDCVIKDGTAVTSGGNIYVNGTCVLTLEGTKTVEQDGTVVYSTQILNGTTTRPAEYACGGSIYVGGSATLDIKCALISGGHAADTAGNIRADGKIIMADGLITGGTSSRNGREDTNKKNSNIQLVGGGASLTMTGGEITGYINNYQNKAVVTVSGSAKIVAYDETTGDAISGIEAPLVIGEGGLAADAKIAISSAAGTTVLTKGEMTDDEWTVVTGYANNQIIAMGAKTLTVNTDTVTVTEITVAP